MPLASVVEKCECGRNNNRKGSHLMTCTCKSGGAPIRSYNSIVSVWCDCLQELNILSEEGCLESVWQHKFMS